MDYLYLIAGLAILVLSGEFLVKGAVGIALKYKVSTLVIGMTIVSLGTSAPELFVSVKAALEGHPDISIGSVVGSNISNIALVLGLTALIFPISVQRSTLISDWPMMMLATIAFYLLSLDNTLGIWEGVCFVSVIVLFSIWIFMKSRKRGKSLDVESEAQPITKNKVWLNIVLVIAGSLGLIYGSDWLVKGAVGIAENFGVSERVISVTIIAFGTSVPELITSCVAAFKKETDISVGNLIGSNLFNILAILGITSIVEEIHVSEETLNMDMYWLLAISLFIFPLMYFGKKVSRLKGVVLVLFYFSYIYFVLF